MYVSLNGEWDLVERPLKNGVSSYAVAATAKRSYAANVPGDVNDDIHRSGKLPEPLVGVNFREYNGWVPQRSWWYRKEFDTPKDAAGMFADLELDGLDVWADIWLNGQHLGRHDTAFCPFTKEVSKLLKHGEKNLLIVRVTTGRERVEHIDDKYFFHLHAAPTEEPRGYPDRGWPQRIFLRKPAYTWGWDWSPALPTCGITGNCGIRFYGVNRIANVRLTTELSNDNRHAVVKAVVELQRETVSDTAWGKVVVRLTCESGCVDTAVAEDVMIRSGLTRVELSLDVNNPRLWWPNGAGRQHRYTVEVMLESEGETVALVPFRWGMRTVALDVRPGVFRFVINGQPIFIQGGNWVPCDHLYGRITPERLRTLVNEAADANLNCLRIWGGGRYERDAFYDTCDERGVMVWHDFMSACAPLPYEEPGFKELFLREAVFQIRRLNNHPCILLWSGNNEVSSSYSWPKGKPLFDQKRDPAWPLYFQDLPRITAAESPAIPYWPSSPYGGKGNVSDPATGDDHHWVVMSSDSKFWSNPEYWDSKKVSLFNSEYGYGGPCCLQSTREYLGQDKPDLFSPVGREHTNTFYDIPRVNFSIERHYTAPAPTEINDYIRLGGLCQGLNYGYSLESQRCLQHNWGGIFWMYNDAWGENGWTIIDYYLRRKISWYFVRRCLAPFKIVLRRGGRDSFGGTTSDVHVILLNATGKVRRGTLCVGYQRYDGVENEFQTVPYRVEPFSRGIVATLPVPSKKQLKSGTVVAFDTNSPDIPSCAWRHASYIHLGLPAAQPVITHTRVDGADLVVNVKTDHFAHAVTLDVPDGTRLSDCWFDLLPGETRALRIHNGASLPQPIRVTCENNGEQKRN